MIEGLSREEILRRFEQWLDSALAAEEQPRGIDADLLEALAPASEGSAEDRRCDSYALWAAMTALTQEVRLQGRAFKDLSDTLGSQAGRAADREAELRREAEGRCRKTALAVLIDLRDRLVRGLETTHACEAQMFQADARSWLARLFSKQHHDPRLEALSALRKGYELTIERLDQVLGEFNAREIPCRGQSFDPRRMNAIDREESNAVPPGTVLEVYRSGYECNGEVFRPAQVKVSHAPAVESVDE